jgi:ribosome biogenesis GTPase A
MSKLNVVRRCYSCGAILQSDDPTKEGYIDGTLLERPLGEVLLCRHCYNESHFNLVPVEPAVDPGFLLMLEDAQASDALIVYVIDTISFETSFILSISERIQGLKMLVLANKRDLLPKGVKDDEIAEYVAHRFRVAKLPVQKEQVILTSLTTMTDTKAIAQRIDEERKRHDVYIIGPVGAGKSLFFTAFLRNYSNVSGMDIQTTTYPGTTIRTMQIPLDASSSIYDTPGTPTSNTIMGLVEPDCARQIMVRTPLKARPVDLSKGDVLYVGGLVQIELLDPGTAKGKHVPLKAYFADTVSLRKGLARKDRKEAFQRMLQRGQLQPQSAVVSSLKDMDVFDFQIDEKGSRDLGIGGYGWVNFTGAGQTFRVYVPKGVSIYGSRCKVK